MDFASSDAELARVEFEKRWADVLDGFHQSLNAYLNDPDLTFESHDLGFPSRDRLSGEYYIGDEIYWMEETTGRRRAGLLLQARFTERPSFEGQQDFDYLALEVRAFIWMDTGLLELDDGLDSSVI